MTKRKRISERHAKRMAKKLYPDAENPNTPIARREFLFIVDQINVYYLDLPTERGVKIDPDQTTLPAPE